MDHAFPCDFIYYRPLFGGKLHRISWFLAADDVEIPAMLLNAPLVWSHSSSPENALP